MSIRSIEPAELRDEVAAILRGHVEPLLPAVRHRVPPTPMRPRLADHAADE